MKKLTAALGVLAFFAAVGSARAATISWNLTAEFSGGATPANTLNVLLEDVSANQVRLTLSLSNVAGGELEFISEFFLNYKGAPAITIANDDVSDATINGTQVGNSAFKADGDGWFDILVDIAPPPGSFADKFTAGESLSFLITGTAGINVNDFRDTSAAAKNGASSPDGLFAAAHAQGIGPTGSDSGWVTVPEPSGMILFGIGTLLAGAAIRRRS